MLEDELDYVLGVDTHRDEHVMVIVTAPAGAVVAGRSVPANARGYRESLRVAGRLAPGRRAWAIEGPAATARALPASWPVVASWCSSSAAHRQPKAAARQRRHARCGPHGAGGACLRDARAAAGWPAPRSVAAVAGGTPRCRRRPSGGAHTAPSRDRHGAGTVRAELRRLPLGKLLERCTDCAAQRQRRLINSRPDSSCAALLAASGRNAEAGELEHEILARVRALAPALLEEPGVGPIVAAQLIIAWSHPGRLRSEACFARLAGVAPIPASSGQTTRHRLSRGGDRQLNRALHTIVLHRRQHDPATRDYIAKRVAEGKTDATPPGY